MSLLRIFGIGGKKKLKPTDYDDGPDALSLAREDMLNRMRARADAPPVELAEPIAAAYPVEADQAAAEAPGPGAPSEVDPLAGMSPDDFAPDPEPEGGAQEGSEASGLDADLLDVFRDAKQETEEGSLASELEDIPIGDLLGDVVGISTRLGVKPAKRRATTSPVAVPPALEPAVEVEPESAADDAPEPAAPPPNLRQVRIEEPEDDPDGDSESEMALAGGYEEEYVDPPFGEARTVPGRRYVLHVLFLGLALTMGAGLGIRGVRGNAFAGNVQATPSALAYLSPPVVPPEPLAYTDDTQETKALQKAPAATPTPAPTPSPSPSPTPRARIYPFIPGQPAWLTYSIESGDSLSSIAEAFGICPDQILWNNPGRKEEDRMIVGDDILLPGYPGIVYRMQKGETLAEVAARYSTTVDMVLAYPANRLKSADDATPGTVVLLPEAIPPSALLQDADAQRAYTNPSADGYIWPFYGPITTYYGEVRPGYVHNAIDIGGLGHFGAPVLAAAAGAVDKVENLYNGLGRYVVISHPDGSRTVYGHMSDVYVQPGDYVRQGEPVGALGCTGHSTGTHLHFELWINGAPVDPLAYLP